METTEIILILAKLAKSEGLQVESPDNDEREIPRWTPNWKGGSKSFERSAGASFTHSGLLGVSNTEHVAASSSGTLWGFASNAASRVWNYVTGNYGVSVHVQVLPVNDLLMRLRDPHRERLADKMRKIMREHSVVDLNVLADKIQQDSSLVRKIILKYLVEYLIEDMSLPVRIPAADD
ncbi:hypothetical protein AVEN_172666-1 [Araneus ventricosus]|uniref:Uncharacterized protein n=1 Tax=Araneus ventricosus TaxID=182803 RepID=A0A4Y2HKC1_ARAVE|nr:hypothetical protein AVEN_172666-1 [Araneus ventricosus]